MPDPLPSVDDDWPEPEPDPVGVVPPEPLLDSCSPTVRFTDDTVPLNVAISCEPARPCHARASESVAVCTLVWSAVIWSLDAPDDSSSDNDAWAFASVAAADETADCRLGESIVASTWPAVTCWPAWTFTAVTVPAAEKLRSSVWAAATVPSADTVFVRLPARHGDELVRRRRGHGSGVVARGPEAEPPDPECHDDHHGSRDPGPAQTFPPLGAARARATGLRCRR